MEILLLDFPGRFRPRLDQRRPRKFAVEVLARLFYRIRLKPKIKDNPMLALNIKNNQQPALQIRPSVVAPRPFLVKTESRTALRPISLGEKHTDDELVALAQEGNPRAFELLMRKYQSRIIALVSRLVGDGDAPDVAQETFIKAHRGLMSFRGQSAFYTWLYRIGVNTAKNHLMSRKRRPTAQDVDVADAEKFGHTAQLSDIDTPEAMLLTSELRHKLSEAIGRLSNELRQAITLREFEGLNYEEIAKVVGCPIGTVRSRIFRAREALDLVIRPLMA